jgi:hypothetical protein
VELAWAVVVGVPVAAYALLATEHWVAGGALVALGHPVAILFTRALHNLGRRWIVFVPAGLVLHDPLTLADPVLLRRQQIETVRPAPAGTDSLDLTQGAPGLAVEVVLLEKVPMTLVRPGRRGAPGSSARFLVTPSRPGAVLADAAGRHLPVG